MNAFDFRIWNCLRAFLACAYGSAAVVCFESCSYAVVFFIELMLFIYNTNRSSCLKLDGLLAANLHIRSEKNISNLPCHRSKLRGSKFIFFLWTSSKRLYITLCFQNEKFIEFWHLQRDLKSSSYPKFFRFISALKYFWSRSEFWYLVEGFTSMDLLNHAFTEYWLQQLAYF